MPDLVYRVGQSVFYEFCIQLQGEDYYRNLLFASSEHIDPSLRPKLTVTFNLCNPMPRRTATTAVTDKPPVIKPLPLKKAASTGRAKGTTGQHPKEEAEVGVIQMESVQQP